MRINEIVIEGFRGFNGRRIITLDSSLTLIYAPNSYGKTSISESLEWLLYGSTSKVQRAEFKDEYKGKSYCPVCKENVEISDIEISYAFKLILDEFKSLGIYQKLELESKY